MFSKYHRNIIMTLSLLAFPASFLDDASLEPSSVTLLQCYDWAKERSENLKIRREDIAQSDARARAALGGALPRLDWELTDTWQDPSGVDELEKKGFSGFVEKEQVESKFV